MDFGIGFLSNNVMLPIIDFFYGIVPSYGLAIVALTLIVRFALYPLSAGSIRNMRKMRIVQPLMQKRMAEIKERYKDEPQKQQEEMVNVQKEFGNPLAGCFPLLVQMPVLLALFATLRGSPFASANYSVNLQIVPAEQIEQIQPQAFATAPQNIYVADGEHVKVAAILPSGNKLAVGEQTKIQYQTVEGKPFQVLLAEHPENKLTPDWKITKGEDRIKIDADGNVEALQPGEVSIQGTIPGLAAEKGFLFIDALGRVGAQDADGTIHWDIVAMIVFFGISLYVSQMLSGQNSSGGNPQQDTVNKITPVIFSGMFLFFPLPAGVLMYMVIGNIFQTAQTYLLSREPLPEELQKIVETQEKEATVIEQKALPFEPKSSKKKATGGS
ncbi:MULTISPECIES: membrane protein insertase YidC [unclassified Nostoc]|uniref:membrane protein insertase YidC n=1 Tax=unclassified Nostoc TaxID=2593658 RepID=UPI000DEC9057|nr:MULTISPECIES: membrane protein insertase YidC [unclassified Nostoc]MBD2507634.1 membrane protein insertase YidC [Desmonostoc muscorum FACHB-395]QHG15388.1 membrane protein insertase YidC [Nostoc sp. ATCC 53789]QLE51866.1 membrane protein insertase YidC [Nostoc sp. C057]RCJ32764.1 membrane protein insertase YidC [Nostoc sp. ATCC 53789]